MKGLRDDDDEEEEEVDGVFGYGVSNGVTAIFVTWPAVTTP